MRRSLPNPLCLALSTLLAATPAVASWRPLGAAAPAPLELHLGSHADTLIVRAVAPDGYETEGSLWRSDDGGASWRSLQPGLLTTVAILAVDPTDDAQLFAWAAAGPYGTGQLAGLRASSDGGVTWQTRFTVPSQAIAPEVRQLIVHPRVPGILYRVDIESNTAYGIRVFTSSDGGATFTAGAFLPAATLPLVLAPGGNLVAFTAQGVATSGDGGVSWQPRGAYRAGGFAQGDSDAAGHLFAIPQPGRPGLPCVVRSRDEGATWSALAKPRLPGGDSRCLEVLTDPQAAGHLWVRVLLVQKGVGRFAVVESTDAGASWSAPRELPTAQMLPGGDERLFAFGSASGSRPLGLYRSDDRGATYARLEAGITTGDLRYDLVAQRRPNGGRRLVGVAGTGAGGAYGLFGSSGGVDWTRLPVSLPYGLVPAGQQALLVISSSNDGVPSLLRSSNSGASWHAIPTPGPASTIPLDLLADATRPGAVLFAGYRDDPYPGVLSGSLSDDGGRTWRRGDSGLPLACSHGCSVDACPSMAAYAVDAVDARRRYLAMALESPCAGWTMAVYRSADAGATWQPAGALPSGLPSYALGIEVDLFSLAADPARADRVLAGTVEGIWESLDAGASWQPLGSGLPTGAAVHQLVHGPGAAWYAATAVDGIFRSEDDGLTWSELAGAPDEVQPALAIDPRGGLLAAFRNLGVWRWTP